jgi:hypothetical protein
VCVIIGCLWFWALGFAVHDAHTVPKFLCVIVREIPKTVPTAKSVSKHVCNSEFQQMLRRASRPSVCSQAGDDKFLRQYIGLFAAHLLISQNQHRSTPPSWRWQNSSWTGGTCFSLIALGGNSPYHLFVGLDEGGRWRCNAPCIR